MSERRSKWERKRLASKSRIVESRNTAEIETAVAAAVAAGAGALLIGTGTFWFNNRVPIIESAAPTRFQRCTRCVNMSKLAV